MLETSFIELIPITWPAMLTSGPPELPELMAASVWITVVATELSLALTVRLVAEMIPLVTVLAYSKPIGDPIAITSWPAAMSLELLKVATVVTLAALIFKTARSVVSSVPTIWASTVLPLLKITWISLEPETTWLLVTT